MSRPEKGAERDFLVCTMHSGGMTNTDIAKHFGVSRERVRQILNRNGLEKGLGTDTGRNLDPLIVVAALHRANSYTDAARLCGHAYRGVRRFVAEMGLAGEIEAEFRRKRAKREAERRAHLVVRVKQLAGTLGRVPNKVDFDACGPSGALLQKHFGSLQAAQVAAGLVPTKIGGRSARFPICAAGVAPPPEGAGP